MENYYVKNDAFERAYKRAKCIDPTENYEDGPFRSRHLAYSTNQAKIQSLSSPIMLYVLWFDELYEDSQKIVYELQKEYKNMENTKSKKMIKQCFVRLYKAYKDIDEFRNEFNELQRCILGASTDMAGSTDKASLLQDQVNYIDLIETRIAQTGDRKLSDVNNFRIQIIGLSLSLTAIVVSVVSIFMHS